MILDACCGGKLMYRGLDRAFTDQEIVSMDIRQGRFHYAHPKYPKTTIIVPTLLADMHHLPFRDSVFTMIVFDPPHDKYGASSYMAMRYGSMGQYEFKLLLKLVNTEFCRVLMPGGILLAKLRDVQVPITKEYLTNFKPLLDNAYWSKSYRSRKKTHWVHFVSRKNILPLSLAFLNFSLPETKSVPLWERLY